MARHIVLLMALLALPACADKADPAEEMQAIAESDDALEQADAAGDAMERDAEKLADAVEAEATAEAERAAENQNQN